MKRPRFLQWYGNTMFIPNKVPDYIRKIALLSSLRPIWAKIESDLREVIKDEDYKEGMYTIRIKLEVEKLEKINHE